MAAVGWIFFMTRGGFASVFDWLALGSLQFPQRIERTKSKAGNAPTIQEYLGQAFCHERVTNKEWGREKSSNHSTRCFHDDDHLDHIIMMPRQKDRREAPRRAENTSMPAVQKEESKQLAGVQPTLASLSAAKRWRWPAAPLARSQGR